MSDEAIRSQLQQIRDPETGRTFGELKMIRSVTSRAEGGCDVVVSLPTPAYPNRERIVDAIRQSLDSPVSVDFATDEALGKNSGGAIGLHIKNVIAVGSGKGGVGKSTVAASIAFGLKSYGAKVGLMDADVYGPSIPHLLGAQGRPEVREYKTDDGRTINRIQPIEKDGVKVISMAFFIEPGKAVVWRGPLLHRAITQFLQDTEWGELDYLIIDLPPGTGDVSLTLSQLLGLAGAVVVCTPQQVALLDAVKAIEMYRQVKIPVLGIVENMSGEIFGRGGAQKKATEMSVPFLGEVPIDAGIRISGDEGRISDVFADDSPSRQAFLGVSEQVAIQVVQQLMSGPKTPTLEVL